jgi:hypothetical protein
MTTHDLLVALFSWWPFIVIIGMWIVLVRLTRSRTASGATMIELYEQQVAEARRTNAVLERIAGTLDKRSLG